MDKGDFVGRHALSRVDKIPLDKLLVGLTTPGTAPADGAAIWNGSDYVGYVTSSTWSPVLDQGVMLGWVDMVDGHVPETLLVEELVATRSATPFYDPSGARARG